MVDGDAFIPHRAAPACADHPVAPRRGGSCRDGAPWALAAPDKGGFGEEVGHVRVINRTTAVADHPVRGFTDSHCPRWDLRAHLAVDRLMDHIHRCGHCKPIRSTDPPDPARRHRFCLLFACAERSRSIHLTPPRRSSRPPSGGRNGLLGSSCVCFIPPTGKIAAHLWVDLLRNGIITEVRGDERHYVPALHGQLVSAPLVLFHSLWIHMVPITIALDVQTQHFTKDGEVHLDPALGHTHIELPFAGDTRSDQLVPKQVSSGLSLKRWLMSVAVNSFLSAAGKWMTGVGEHWVSAVLAVAYRRNQ